MSSKRVYIETNGCAVIRHDTQRYSKYFRLNGWKEIDNSREADLILMTTCGVTQSTENFALESISRIKKEKKKEAKLIVGGCLPKINPKKLESFGCICFSPDEEETIDTLIEARIPIKDIFWDGDIFREHSLGDPELKYSDEEILQLKVAKLLTNKFSNPQFLEIHNYLTKGRYFWKEDDLFEVKVADGCIYECSYCATRNAKGKLKSRDPQRIKKEFKFSIDRNYPKILLTGDEVGEYGTDIGTNLIELLESLSPESKNAKIALRYMSPSSLIRYFNELKPYFESQKIYYFCSSFQSGSPRIIKLMNRPNNLDSLMEVVSEIDREYPLIYKHSQMIVGFPGETEEDFQQSIEFMRKSGFDYISVFKYSPRPNTKAINLEDHVPSEVMEFRYQKAREVFYEIRRRKLQEKLYHCLLKEASCLKKS